MMSTQEKYNALIIDDKDNVVVAIYALSAGDNATFKLKTGEVETINVLTDIPCFHKIARKNISKGSTVIKYGEYIGVATQNIKAGEHVHTHSCQSSDAQKNSKQITVNNNQEVFINQNDISDKSFMGYIRSDGRVGIRNNVLVLPTSICASDVCSRIVDEVEGTVTFHNQNGCSQVSIDQELTVRTIAGFAANPNIASVLAISLGCENCQNDLVVDEIKKITNKKVESIIIQEVGGSQKTIQKGIELAKKLVEEAKTFKREKCSLDKIILGTNCGGSDPSSGLGSNPLIGEVSDWFVAQGATTVLCETPEIYGAEHILATRAIDKKVGDELIKIVKDYEKYVQQFGVEMREGNPSPGNMAGGLTTLEEKSLGCIHKAGHSSLNAVYGYAEQLKTGEGLIVMDTPGNDASSVAGIIAGGCQLVVFSTGLGTPTGNAIAPVLRITANPHTAKTMADNTDMDCSDTIFGPKSMSEMKEMLIDQIIDVCNGVQTCAEKFNYTETALPHICNYM